MTIHSRTNPSFLPPTARAAFLHGLRVYHKLKVWQHLLNIGIEPLMWGWQMKDNLSIMTDAKSDPKNLL